MASRGENVGEMAEALRAACKEFPGARVCESEAQPLMMDLAAGQAKYMARVRRLGHQHFDRRVAELQRVLGNLQYAEIAAESWPEQADAPLEALGLEMFKSWSQSQGHWSVASKSHRYWGGSMARGRNGIWYACIIVGD